MADKRISELDPVTTPTPTDEFAVVQAGNTRRMTREQVHTLESGETFVGPVTGAVTGDVTGHVVGPVFDVQHADYGAVGDGTTDDTAAIQAAIDDAEAVNGTVLFPAGDYKVTDQITVTASIRLVGTGGAVLDMQLPIDHTDQSLFEVDASRVSFEGLVFDGDNAPAGTLAQRIIAIRAHNSAGTRTDFRVTGCEFINLSRRGTPDVGSGPDAATASEYGLLVADYSRVWITHNRFSNVSGVCADIREDTDVVFAYNTCAMLDSGDADLYQVHIRHDCRRVWVVHNSFGKSNSHGGGAIDVMANTQGGVNKEIYVVGNLLDGFGGGSSGGHGIRFLSVENGVVAHNILRASGDDNPYIFVGNRTDAGGDQPGPINNHIAYNVLEAGAAKQVGIDVRHDDTVEGGGEHVQVVGNILRGDGTNFFAGGIRLRDIIAGSIVDNSIEYSRDNTASFFVGIQVVAFDEDLSDVLVADNYIDGRDVTSSRGIETEEGGGHTLSRTKITGNRIVDCKIGIIEANGEDAFVWDNVIVNANTEVSVSGGTPSIRGNVNHVTEANGTATLESGNTSVAVTHGLAETPSIQDISVTPIEAWGSATQFWIDTPTSTQFTINVDQNPTQDVDFAWTAQVL